MMIFYVVFVGFKIINKPHPNLHSGDASIQGTLALVSRGSPE